MFVWWDRGGRNCGGGCGLGFSFPVWLSFCTKDTWIKLLRSLAVLLRVRCRIVRPGFFGMLTFLDMLQTVWNENWP